LKWYQRAADQGHAKAQYHLGVLYSESDTVPADNMAALMWFILAEQQGYAEAKESGDLARSRLSAEQVAEVERRARARLQAQRR
jgi:TPR repeat protein